MTTEELASAIVNDVEAGIVGLHENITLSQEQIEDEVIATREAVIFEWWRKGILQRGDLLTAINCIDVDCKDPTKCCTSLGTPSDKHFEIPQLVTALGEDSIYWIGSADRKDSYKVYFTPSQLKYRKYKKRNADKPYVYIERTPNENGMYDGWIYNLPFVKQIALIGVFKDPRQLAKIGCDGNCDGNGGDYGSIAMEVKNRITKEKLYYYRQALQPPHRNDQTAR